MKRALRLFGLIALSWLGVNLACADDTAEAKTTPITDPAQVSAHYREVVQRPEFQVSDDQDINAHLKEALSQAFLRLGEKFGEFKYAGEMSNFASMLLTVFAALAVIGLIYVLVRLIRRSGDSGERVDAGGAGQKLFRPPEFYEKEIQDAIGARDWHAAWLATWRQFLSRLEMRQLVEADRTRTNREYLEQLRKQALPAPALTLLGGMVDAYDRFIYGRKSISEPEWTLFHQQINEAGLLLHLDDKAGTSRLKAGAT